MKLRYFLGIAQLPLLLSIISCKKFIDATPPVTSISAASVYTSDASAISVLTGIYAKISQSPVSNPGTIPSLTLFAGLSADEFTPWSGLSTNQSVQSYYKNALSASLGYGSEFWASLYPLIYSCNAAVGGLNNSTGLSSPVRKQLLGEAKFMRAFIYFYLVNLYGDLPLPLDSNYAKTSSLPRTTSNLVYAQIISDLHDAQQGLSSTYLDGSLLNPSNDRVRPTIWAATAMLARAYLYTGNWTGADSAATILINNNSLFSLSGLDSTFLRSVINNVTVNKEAIWQLQPVTTAPNNTFDAYSLIIPSTGLGTVGSFGVYLNNNLLTSFEPGDKRKTHWIGSVNLSGTLYYYPFKYKVNSLSTTIPVTEYLSMLRLSEQYLIRAEARANEGNLSGAANDINLVRSRAGLSSTSATTQNGLLTAILHERRVELFAELGHRWLDLKRSNSVDSVMTRVTPQKGGGGSSWQSYQQLYPIRNMDIQLDPNLKQNPGF